MNESQTLDHPETASAILDWQYPTDTRQNSFIAEGWQAKSDTADKSSSTDNKATEEVENTARVINNIIQTLRSFRQTPLDRNMSDETKRHMIAEKIESAWQDGKSNC